MVQRFDSFERLIKNLSEIRGLKTVSIVKGKEFQKQVASDWIVELFEVKMLKSNLTQLPSIPSNVILESQSLEQCEDFFIVCVSVYAVEALQRWYLAHSNVTHSIMVRKSIVIQWYCCDSTPSVASKAFRASEKVKEDEEGNEQVFALFVVAQKAHENWYIFLLSVFVSFALTSSLCRLILDLRSHESFHFSSVNNQKDTKTLLFHKAWYFLMCIWTSLIRLPLQQFERQPL